MTHAEQMAEREFPIIRLDNGEDLNEAERTAYIKGWENAAMQIELLYKKWLKETERSGSVVTGKSVSEFFEYLKTK